MAGVNRPYNNKVNKNTNRRSNRAPQKRRSNQDKSEMEATTRIRIDDGRLNDSDSLDTSFLEGRIDKKVKKNKKAKEKILIEKKPSKVNKKLIRNIFVVLLVLVLCGLLVFFLMNSIVFSKKEDTNNVKPKVTVKEKIVTKVDENYLFVGDYQTSELDFDGIYNHYVVVGKDDYTVTEVLDNMKEYIYDYNPSIIFIELGMNDLVKGDGSKEVIDNIESMIKGIKDNRPYAKIYVESLYPIDEEHEDFNSDYMNGITIDDITSFNEKLKKLCKSNKVNYLDMFTELSEKGVLKDNYSDDGIVLNNAGIKRVLKVINRVVDDEE